MIVTLCGCSEELFYQLGLLQFGAYARLTLEPPPDIRTLLETAMQFIPESDVAEVDKSVKIEVRPPPIFLLLLYSG